MKFKLWILLIAASLAACGGSSSKSSSPAPTTQITGAVEAPAGTVAQLQPVSPIQYALNFFVSPAVAAITGLQPVTGATVELIRVDNDGNQVGAVLATTVTSITGDYTLSLPPGINLAGNLVLRVSGTGGAEMRAQVVEREVKINPVSEFVLRSFIDNGADLDNLTTAAVVKIKGQLDDFDLTRVAGSNLDEMLNNLKAQTAGLIDSAIAAETAQPATSADLNNIAGSYRNVAFDWELDSYTDYLHDNNQVNALGISGWVSDFNIVAGQNGTLTLKFTGEEGFYGRLQRPFGLYHEVDLYESFDESIAGKYTNTGLLSVDIPFEEDIVIDQEYQFGFRTPPMTFTTQQVANSNVLIAPAMDAEVRYALIDTNNDNERDALNPAERLGDTASRGLEIFMKKPSAATGSNLTGDFGRVYLRTQLNSYGEIELEAEHNKLTFGSTLSSSATGLDVLKRSVDNGSAPPVLTFTGRGDSENNVDAETGIVYGVQADGRLTIDGESVDGYTNDAFDLIVFNEFEEEVYENDSGRDLEKSIILAVKLPTSLLALNGKQYRVIGTQANLSPAGLQLDQFRFNSLLTMTADNAASIKGGISSIIQKNNSISSDNRSLEADGIAISIANDGVMSFELDIPAGTGQNQPGGKLKLEGYMNHNGSLAILHTIFTTSSNQVIAMGLVTLVELP